MKIWLSLLSSCAALLPGLLALGPGQAEAQAPIKIGFVQGLSSSSASSTRRAGRWRSSAGRSR